jgi:hypothetical protein
MCLLDLDFFFTPHRNAASTPAMMATVGTVTDRAMTEGSTGLPGIAMGVWEGEGAGPVVPAHSSGVQPRVPHWPLRVEEAWAAVHPALMLHCHPVRTQAQAQARAASAEGRVPFWQAARQPDSSWQKGCICRQDTAGHGLVMMFSRSQA